MITCKELIEFILEHLADELTAEQQQQFQEHLAVCPSCVNYLESYERTVSMAKDAHRDPTEAAKVPAVPEELILRAIFKERQKGKHS